MKKIRLNFHFSYAPVELTFYSSIFLEQRFETRQNVVIFPSMILVNYHGYRGIVYVKIAKFFSPRMSNILWLCNSLCIRLQEKTCLKKTKKHDFVQNQISIENTFLYPIYANERSVCVVYTTYDFTLLCYKCKAVRSQIDIYKRYWYHFLKTSYTGRIYLNYLLYQQWCPTLYLMHINWKVSPAELLRLTMKISTDLNVLKTIHPLIQNIYVKSLYNDI